MENYQDHDDSRRLARTELRRRAEECVHARQPQQLQPLSEEQVRALLHELQVHQVELEMQNEELVCAEAAAREMSEKYMTLFDLAPTGYVVLDEQEKILEANLAGAALLGHDRTTIRKQRFGSFVLGDDRRSFSEFYRRLFQTGTRQSGEFRSDRGEQSVCVLVEGIVSEGREGHCKECRISLTDITERKQAEENKLELERRMLYAQKLESLGVLAGGIAHDFNNILTVIRGHADLAMNRLPPSDPVQEDLQIIEEAVCRAVGLTRQMLAFSGKGRFVVEPVNLSNKIREMQALLKASVSKKATITFELDTELPAILADASQIQQAVLNLVINASEALGDQVGAIAISTHDELFVHADSVSLDFGEELPEGRYVRLEVSDTGCGMDSSTMQRMFDPFFTTKFTGRGLGLAAIRGIVRGHGGAIQIVSAPEKGTTFRVFFPASSTVLDAADAEAVAAEPWRGSGTILVVDDEARVRDMVQCMLEKAGFSVLTAQDGDDAIRLFRQCHHQLRCVLLDLTMPKKNGAEALRGFREINPRIPVIIASGYSEDDVRSQFLGQTLSAVVSRPYQSSELINALRQSLAE